MSRLEKAKSDLFRWRESRRAALRQHAHDGQLKSAISAVDAAFKSEVLEFRIRQAVNAQALNESSVSHEPAHNTQTGQHVWDFDWWLTEATMRRLHCGNDALAQLLNLLFELGVDRESKGFPGKVANALRQRPKLRGVYDEAKKMFSSPEFKDLSAFVNHVKHVGFPERKATAMPDGLNRATEVGAFSTEFGAHGPWSPSDLNTIIDGVRRQMIAVVDSAVEVVR